MLIKSWGGGGGGGGRVKFTFYTQCNSKYAKKYSIEIEC